MTNLLKQSDYQYREIRNLLEVWLQERLDREAANWIQEKAQNVANQPEDWELYTSFSAVPQHTGKSVLEFSKEEMNRAESLRKNWRPVEWAADQLGRVYLLLSFAENGKTEFLEKIEKIFVTSDLSEAVALYKGLALYPYPEEFTNRAAEGVRSNMTTVFNAVAHYNPYPSEYLEKEAWNQIVLKALFVESALYKIVGLDDRANKTLAQMLVEYAHERWSAGREVSPELWRPVGPFLDDEYLDDIKKVINHPDTIQKQSAILALMNSDYSKKDELLDEHKDLVNEIKEQNITWDDIGMEFENG